MEDAPLFSYYGDDFTGSTDALEALASNGIPTVLFLSPPSDAGLAAFPGCRAIGIAGDSRSRSPEWMRDELPAIFARLREIGAPVVQYKICSTFDSSPEAGNIGCALEIGQDVFGVPYVPVVAAAPKLERYVLFGNLFAAGGKEGIRRIDYHPTMSRHPVTPMTEADLRLHLAKQTERRLALLDIVALGSASPNARFEQVLRSDPEVVLFDGLDDKSLVETARLIWQHRHHPQAFVVGSSGFAYGMMDLWRSQGLIPPASSSPAAGRAERLLALAGSLSPVTERQICYALRNGFRGFLIDIERLAGPGLNEAYRASLAAQVLELFEIGCNVILYTALGRSDHREIADRSALGRNLGRLLRELIVRSGVRRVVVAGGDTSSHAVRELDIAALTFSARLAPGAPLCRTHAAEPALSGLDLVLKGGQVGAETFFEDALRGR